MNKLIDFDNYPVHMTIKQLLKDRTTQKPIIWATDTYKELGYDAKDEINHLSFYGPNRLAFQPRVMKSDEQQNERTRSKGEVFTPCWIVNKMNNYLDEDWFQRKDVFNKEEGTAWIPVPEKICFPDGRTWKDYVDSRRLEITCGEGPFLCSRYDSSTGDFIVPTIRRIGILDRKLRIVNENTDDIDEWNKWALRALQSCYGYEYQGDSLIMARINMLMSYVEYHEEKWGSLPEDKNLNNAAKIISWNIWQMDGLTGTIPMGALYPDEGLQMSLLDFGIEFDDAEEKEENIQPPCKVFDWRSNKSIVFNDMKKGEG